MTSLIAWGQIKEGQMMATAEQYNARVAEANAQVARETAAFETETLTQQSQFEQDKIAREKGQMISAQKASFAKSGVRVDVGTPLEVMADTAAQYELDIAANKYNLATGREAIRYERDVSVSRYATESTYRNILAKHYKEQGYFKAAGTILTTAKSAAGAGG